MDFKKIENRVLALSPYLENIKVSLRGGRLFASMTPDFEALQKANIINIEDELKWYAVELYNLEVPDEEKIRGYEIVYPKISSEEEPKEDEIYRRLKGFLQTLSSAKINYNSHLELDLGLDSIDYVELFIFVEESFGVLIDEKNFASMMRLHELYLYVKEHCKAVQNASSSLNEALKEPIKEKLRYSPFIMLLYKIFLFPLFKLYFRLEVSGRENIPQSPCIFAPSHQSMLDGFLVESSLPYKTLKNTFFLAYKNVFGTKFLKPISDNGQTILIDANENLKHTLQYVALPLHEHKNLVIFPEGARTRDRELLEFRPFFAMLSKLYNVPVVPVLVDGSFEALRSGTLFPKPKKIIVRYLEPIYPDGLDVAEITQKTKDAIAYELKSNGVFSR
ncbi:MAG: glycerol acyltransferase [Sulfurimonas sp.]|nr:glycerol acyltransferase [Sulfurimonas sp.]MBU3940047.1 1-acyl-sn-glycerol-3-phosphate acyltransferase [bacterium]MBU4025266.1 1-acyl-sn-glycerol-3-phosphate acyltransferase [bacterium]MBU4110384.1 1-acyl-sn-glycerol-3-phosphate acyltransferase [bacterium]